MYLFILSTFHPLGMPLVIVLGCYLSIYRQVRKSHAALHQAHRGNVSNKPSTTNILPVKKEDMQLAITLFATFVIFMILWSPYMGMVAVDRAGLASKELHVIFIAMGHTNSMLNVFTYGVCNNNFRQGYKVFLNWLFCRQRNNNVNGGGKDISSVATLSSQ